MSLREHAVRVARFGGASGVGLILDYAVYTVLHAALGVPAGLANLCSATVGITFVYFASLRHVFHHLAAPEQGTFLRYLAWQAVAVPVASVVVGLLESALDGKFLLAKTLVVPFTFGANYLFMHWLLHRSSEPAPAPAR